VITRENLVEAMTKLAMTITTAQIDEIMEKHDTEKTGSISFNEFKVIFEEMN